MPRRSVRTLAQVITQDLPEALRNFIREECRIPADVFRPLPGDRLPEPARQLLFHSRDMTSTLGTFHESPLRVEILRRQRENDFYLREVFLRTIAGDAIVEYGVIGIALDQFTPSQQEAIETGQAPLGGLLHRFAIPFTSAPIGFFSIRSGALGATRFSGSKETTCYGRFNRLTKSTGEPLAWILEILPP